MQAALSSGGDADVAHAPMIVGLGEPMPATPKHAIARLRWPQGERQGSVRGGGASERQGAVKPCYAAALVQEESDRLAGHELGPGRATGGNPGSPSIKGVSQILAVEYSGPVKQSPSVIGSRSVV
jgi:hypothetical protein